MGIKENEVKIDIIRRKNRTFDDNCSFVIIKHIESGITVTSCDDVQLVAKKDAMQELNILVGLWKE